jgi:hypothetical protein
VLLLIVLSLVVFAFSLNFITVKLRPKPLLIGLILDFDLDLVFDFLPEEIAFSSLGSI